MTDNKHANAGIFCLAIAVVVTALYWGFYSTAATLAISNLVTWFVGSAVVAAAVYYGYDFIKRKVSG